MARSGRSPTPPARPAGLAPVALLAAAILPVAYGLVLNWRMAGAPASGTGQASPRIALCAVAAAALAAGATAAMPADRDEGGPAMPLRLAMVTLIAGVVAFSLIAIAPWIASAVCDVLPTHSLFAFWRCNSVSNSVSRGMTVIGFAILVLMIGALSLTARCDKAKAP